MGDDDGGKLFTPEEYAAYKKKVLPKVGQADIADRQTDI